MTRRPMDLVVAELAVRQHWQAGEQPCEFCANQLRRIAAHYGRLNRKSAA